MVIIAIGGLAVAGFRTLVARSGYIGLFINLAIFSVFSAGYLKAEFPLRFPLTVVLVLLGMSCVFADASSSDQRKSLSVILASGVVVALAVTLLYHLPGTAGELDKLFRYVIILPIAFLVGSQLRQSQALLKWVESYRFWTMLFAAGAILEYFRGSLFSPREGFVVSLGSLSFRTALWSEHPLVLALLILAGVPYLFLIKRRMLRLAALSTAGVAIWTTGSYGPLTLFALFVFCFMIAPHFSLSATGWAKSLRFGAFAVLLGLALLGTVLSYGQQAIVTSTSDNASIQYRAVLYASIWPSLGDHPFGWGLSGLPEGVLLAPSAGRILDLSKTIDSEFTLLTLEFGWAGLALGFAALALAIRSKALTSPVGQSAILITVAGFFLALHAWLGLGTLWLLYLGMLWGSNKPEPGTSVQSPSTILASTNTRSDRLRRQL
jgi:hypothetical protein